MKCEILLQVQDRTFTIRILLVVVAVEPIILTQTVDRASTSRSNKVVGGKNIQNIRIAQVVVGISLQIWTLKNFVEKLNGLRKRPENKRISSMSKWSKSRQKARNNLRNGRKSNRSPMHKIISNGKTTRRKIVSNGKTFRRSLSRIQKALEAWKIASTSFWKVQRKGRKDLIHSLRSSSEQASPIRIKIITRRWLSTSLLSQVVWFSWD